MPTIEPTNAPSTPTIPPTPFPTDQPTLPTVSPTLSPTYVRERCDDGSFGYIKWCYFVDIYPEDTGISEYEVELYAESDFLDTHLEIKFSNQGASDCNNPMVTFKYENIDLDQVIEYLEVYDGIADDPSGVAPDEKLLERCGDRWECGTFSYCLKNYELSTFGNVSIAAGDNYTFTIVEQAAVNALCASPYSVYGQFILTCSNIAISNATNPDGVSC